MSLTDINALLDAKGYAFDDKDLLGIQDSLTKSEAEFEEVSRLKEDLEKRLQETSARFAYLKDAIADYKTALRCNPIRILIPEILSYTFLEYCGIHSGQLPSYLTSDDLASTFEDISRRRNVLLSVCRRWRYIVSTTPRLWAAIDLSGPYIHSRRTSTYPFDHTTWLIPPHVRDQHWERIDQAIERAGCVPLSIVQNVGGHSYLDVAFQNEEWAAMLQKLVEVLPRTQDVYLQFTPCTAITLPALSDHPDCWPHNPMPHLKTFHVSSIYTVVDMSPWIYHFLRQVPPEQLVDVELSSCGNDELFVDNISRMTHVKRLSLSPCSLASVQSLESTPLLEKLSITSMDFPLGGPRPVPVCLSQLSSLTLVGFPTCIEGALSWLTLPSLQHMDLHIVFIHHHQTSVSSLPNFFERSQCRLQTLNVQDNSLITPSVLLDVFRLQEQSLTSISLIQGNFAEIDRAVLNFLTGTPNQMPLPLLRHLELKVPPKQVPGLSRLLQHRFSMVTQSSQITCLEFCRINVQSRTSLSPDSIQKHRNVIQPFRDAGLDVEMVHSQKRW